MESAEPAGGDQARDNLLDVCSGQMMAQIDQALRLATKFLADHERGTPIVDYARVKGGLEWFVFDQQTPVMRERFIDVLKRIDGSIERAPEVLLPREIRAIAQPDNERIAAKRLAEFDAANVMLDSPSADRRIGVRKRTEFVRVLLATLILKGVRVHRIELEMKLPR